MAASSEIYSGISLFVGREELGVFIRDIQEIIEPIPILSVPVTHPYFSGLISLRGSVLPVLALNAVFHSSENAFSNKDRKYVICQSGSESLAIDVDAVGDTFESDQLIDADERFTQPFINSAIVHNDKTLPLLNISDLITLTSHLNQEKRKDSGYVLTDN
ncbi:chemotaxis protein CheW [Sporolactobacillus kofuensis]|uniref:Chemotaxis protein CheW n=1 Tax=Sporolactobacillus kofuensis TaxID=269672 RepID=A0ABW1WEL1_9BACL|nr:chemotaxis protein CheW [Sporolactobacillus kofuensis]MCO7175251.1 chemotaxis protein CheW [Sporolactobacillus kofuensis]